MSAIDLTDVVREFRKADSFLIATHAGPDGDAIGSMLALSHLLRAMGKENVTCACADPAPRVYRWLPGADSIVDATEAKARGPYELVVIVDVARRNRIGAVSDAIDDDARILVLDHHLDDAPCGTLNLIDPTYAAMGEFVGDLFEAADVAPSVDAAACAYVALATDTGSFRFSSTTARSHRVAARLVEAGIDVAAISSRIFDSMSHTKFHLLTRVLSRVQFALEGRVAYSEVTEREMEELCASGEDLDGLINFARNIEGVEVAMLFKEVGGATTKVSLRSRSSFNSATFLQRFGGGGHSGAAGATIPLPLRQARSMVLEEAASALGERV